MSNYFEHLLYCVHKVIHCVLVHSYIDANAAMRVTYVAVSFDT